MVEGSPVNDWGDFEKVTAGVPLPAAAPAVWPDPSPDAGSRQMLRLVRVVAAMPAEPPVPNVPGVRAVRHGGRRGESAAMVRPND